MDEAAIQALRQAIGQIGATVEILVNMLAPNPSDPDVPAQAVATSQQMKDLLVEAKSALDEFDSLVSE